MASDEAVSLASRHFESLQVKQEAQLMLTNPRDAFRGQLRSPNMVAYNSIC